MATQEQKDTVRKLHEINDRTLGGYADGQYDIAQPVTKTKDDAGADLLASGDPYERYYAEKIGGLLTPDAIVTGLTLNSSAQSLAVGGTFQIVPTVTYSSTVGTNAVTYEKVIGAADISVDSAGLVTVEATASVSDTATIRVTSVEDVTFDADIVITVI